MSADRAGAEDWVPGKGHTLEELRDHALMCLARIDRDREIKRLLEAGLTVDEVIARTGFEPRFVRLVRQYLDQGRPVRPETPEELGWRRAVGQISTREMMERLRTWPYTFSRLHGYDGYERGSWNDIRTLLFDGFITGEEYHELRVIVDALPRPPEPGHGTEEYRRG